MAGGPTRKVWTASSFFDIANRNAVDKALQRLATDGRIRRIDRGLYDIPRVSTLTGKPSSPDHTAVIDAVAVRDGARMLVDGITAANVLGLTNAVPAHITVMTDARLQPVNLGELNIVFKTASPASWLGRGDRRRTSCRRWAGCGT
ncbi:DUF6088 family protein [Azospirillum argentinense]|uniref:DUF6088 family protein n=1 Tax=Azospirillum argentinense TaxID=2970906 RepID=UPI001FFF5466|nr:DUF6088 family protein [Azospirillum argentinense]